MLSFNTNSSVFVKLTKNGVDEWEKNFNKFKEFIEWSFDEVYDDNTKDGWSEFQMWELMRIFGNQMFMGNEQMFESNEMLFKETDFKKHKP